MRVLLFAISVFFLCSVEAASSGGKAGKLGSVADSGHGGTGGGSSSTGRTRYQDPRKAPPLEETRKVSEQDCSKPVDLSAGNLRCK
jgi:hypothetical protein